LKQKQNCFLILATNGLSSPVEVKVAIEILGGSYVKGSYRGGGMRTIQSEAQPIIFLHEVSAVESEKELADRLRRHGYRVFGTRPDLQIDRKDGGAILASVQAVKPADAL